MKESDVYFTELRNFLERAKTYCGGCGAEDKRDLLTCARCKVIMYCNVKKTLERRWT